MLEQAEVYVYEDDDTVCGFAGLDGEHIEGIFVREEMRSRGIGKSLIDHVKDVKRGGGLLSMCMLKTHLRYLSIPRRDFTVCSEGTDDNTGEKDYVMIWKKS